MPSIKVRKYGNSVYIVYAHKHELFKIYSGVKILDKYWNLCAPRKNCPDIENVKHQVSAMETRVLNASMRVRAQGTEPTVALVRREFYNQLAPSQERKLSIFQ